ncbi:MAG TPA: NAD(P)/FAD-dependent oxidoreductase, partial [Firmicutes bacterium]|nr:NAD(P)/FAD-dependent oxidoreductase [Bacillota bacterium]
MKMLSTTYAIIGSGPAALFAAEAIRKRDAEGKLLMFGAEGYPPYSRPLTSYYLAGLVPKE